MTDESNGPDDNEHRDLWSDAKELFSTRPYRRGQIIYAGMVLGVFDALEESPEPAAEVAEQLDLHADRAYRLLRALAAIGLLTEDDERQFAIRSLGKPFQSDHPRSLVDRLRLSQGPELVSTMQHLPEVIRGGPDGFVREYGETFYEYTDKTPDFARAFHGAMSQPSSDGEPVSDYFEAEDFASVEHLCDVGGGEGRLLCAVLAEYPHLEGTVFDVPTAIEGAHRLADSMGVAGRCSYVAGDMFETVPAADGYIFRGVLSNWADDECETILSNVHEAANAEARLFVIQRIVSEHAPSEREVIGDISQLVYFGGRHRTRGEFRRVFERSGWTLESSRAVEDNISSVLVARKAGT